MFRRRGRARAGAALSLAGLLAALLAAAAGADTEPARCCPGGGPLVRQEPYCGGPGGLALACPDGMFLLDPAAFPEDAFRQTADGGLLVGDGPNVVPAGGYCLGHIRPRGSNESGSAGEEDAAAAAAVALVCFERAPPDRGALNGACLCVSLVFLLATLLVYALLPPLRDLDGRVLVGYTASLAVAFLALAVLQFRGDDLQPGLCVASAYTLYYFMLAAFFWLNVLCFNVWRRTVSLRMPVAEARLFGAYCCYALGAPTLLLGAALLAEHVPGEHLRPLFGHSKCWFNGRSESWAYFYGPAAALIAFNTIFFVWTGWALWRDHSHIQGEGKLRSLRYKCLLYVKLAVLMGVFWIFEIISFGFDDTVPFFWYVTDVINGLQGLLIFVLVVATRRRVLRLLSLQRPCGLPLPARWAHAPDDESEAMLAEEDGKSCAANTAAPVPAPAAVP